MDDSITGARSPPPTILKHLRFGEKTHRVPNIKVDTMHSEETDLLVRQFIHRSGDIVAPGISGLASSAQRVVSNEVFWPFVQEQYTSQHCLWI
jgi:hypothetical protein